MFDFRCDADRGVRKQSGKSSAEPHGLGESLWRLAIPSGLRETAATSFTPKLIVTIVCLALLDWTAPAGGSWQTGQTRNTRPPSGIEREVNAIEWLRVRRAVCGS